MYSRPSELTIGAAESWSTNHCPPAIAAKTTASQRPCVLTKCSTDGLPTAAEAPRRAVATEGIRVSLSSRYGRKEGRPLGDDARVQRERDHRAGHRSGAGAARGRRADRRG